LDNNKKTENRTLIGMIENIHLLRKLFIRRSTADSPLHFGQVAIMRTIAQNENCTQATLAEELKVTPASVAVSTKRLQKAGFITKTVDSENLRCKRLALTDKGREAINQQCVLFKQYDEHIFRSFSENEKAQLAEYLSRMISEMKQLEGIAENTDSIQLTLLLRRAMGTLIPEAESEKNKAKSSDSIISNGKEFDNV